jgi:hypothetical protein
MAHVEIIRIIIRIRIRIIIRSKRLEDYIIIMLPVDREPRTVCRLSAFFLLAWFLLIGSCSRDNVRLLT